MLESGWEVQPRAALEDLGGALAASKLPVRTDRTPWDNMGQHPALQGAEGAWLKSSQLKSRPRRGRNGCKGSECVANRRNSPVPRLGVELVSLSESAQNISR